MEQYSSLYAYLGAKQSKKNKKKNKDESSETSYSAAPSATTSAASPAASTSSKAQKMEKNKLKAGPSISSSSGSSKKPSTSAKVPQIKKNKLMPEQSSSATTSSKVANELQKAKAKAVKKLRQLEEATALEEARILEEKKMVWYTAMISRTDYDSSNMGQTLSEPVTAKESAACQNHLYKVGSSCMQGWRITMEDSHTHILSLPDDQEAAFFAVYDGHGGANVAQHAGNNLHKCIVQRREYQSGDIATAVREGFLEFDNTMMKDELMRDEVAGTTAVTVLIRGHDLYCGNVGDSRAVACINGAEHPLSSDHKPNNPMESMRINNAGGWVEYNRVNGNLALSRALGDFVFKRNPSKSQEEQMVIALPDVEYRKITEDWEFVVLACDGVWDVLTNHECVNFIRFRLGDRMEPEKICEELMTNCLSPDCQMGGLGCDNMTVILVCFLHGKSWEEYCGKIAASLEPNIEGFANAVVAGDDPDELTALDHENAANLNLGDNEESVDSVNCNVVSSSTSVENEPKKAEGKSQEDGPAVTHVIQELSEAGVLITGADGEDKEKDLGDRDGGD